MNLSDFNCDSFVLILRFKAEEFDKDAFLKEIEVEDESEYTDEDGDLFLALHFASREESSKQHGNFSITVRPGGQCRATFNFHTPGPKRREHDPPYLEDSIRWFGRFVKRDELSADIRIVYVFDKTFTTTIPLPFPLVASSKELAGLKVTGLSLQYPERARVSEAIIQNEGKTLFLFLGRQAVVVRPKEFDFIDELKDLAPTVDILVKKKESDNASR